MTIFRFSFAAACALATAFPAREATAAQADKEEKLEDCTTFGEQGDIAVYQCVGRNNQRKERHLQESFDKAQLYVEEHQDKATVQDVRRSPIYLDWSQAAWKQYAEQNCTVVAGLSGGSNAWVSRYWLDCYSEELDRRIKFLEEVAAGQINAG